MDRYGLNGRWAYRFPWQSQWFGLSDTTRREVIRSSDLLINVSGTLANLHEYRAIPRMIFIDSDPVFTQIKLRRGQHDFRKMVDAHDAHFSFGECLEGNSLSTGHCWWPTRQPIVLSEWKPSPTRRNVFTTVMNWTSYKPVEYEGKTYGQKDVEFMRFIDLPSCVNPAELEIAVNAGKTRRTPRSLLRRKEWLVADPDRVCPDMTSYRDYIASSYGEWSVAKNGYVEGRSGWFSCRSACYLAAGRPVVVQDTGFPDVIPTGVGILPFRTVEEAADGIREVTSDYARHSKAAREIAEACFDSDTVLGKLVEVGMNRGHGDKAHGGLLEATCSGMV